jgi:hypothetical protein
MGDALKKAVLSVVFRIYVKKTQTRINDDLLQE